MVLINDVTHQCE